MVSIESVQCGIIMRLFSLESGFILRERVRVFPETAVYILIYLLNVLFGVINSLISQIKAIVLDVNIAVNMSIACMVVRF